MLVAESLPRLTTNHWPFSLDWLPTSAFLVGGAVRDALIQRRREYFDLDFVVPQRAIATAKALANAYQAGFVVLDEQRQIARVVFPQGTVDFAQQEGDTLEIDLHRRDFTINAIAYQPHQGKFIDPLGGLRDIEQGTIRMVSPGNLADDPLRLLRAYRQAAQLRFQIDPATRVTIRELAPRLVKVAPERVQNELFYLFSSLHGNQGITLAWEDGLLAVVFPQVSLKQFKHCQQIDAVPQLLQEHFSNEQLRQLLGEASPERWPKPIQLAKLASLLPSKLAIAERVLGQLKCSRHDSRAILAALKQLPRLHQAWLTPMSTKEQYFFYLELGAHFPLAMVLALAQGIPTQVMLPLVQQYLDPVNPVAHPPNLITGRDLIQHLNLRPSPLIGQLLSDIQVAIAQGQVTTKAKALQLAESLLKQDNGDHLT